MEEVKWAIFMICYYLFLGWRLRIPCFSCPGSSSWHHHLLLLLAVSQLAWGVLPVVWRVWSHMTPIVLSWAWIKAPRWECVNLLEIKQVPWNLNGAANHLLLLLAYISYLLLRQVKTSKTLLTLGVCWCIIGHDGKISSVAGLLARKAARKKWTTKQCFEENLFLSLSSRVKNKLRREESYDLFSMWIELEKASEERKSERGVRFVSSVPLMPSTPWKRASSNSPKQAAPSRSLRCKRSPC